MKYRKKPIEVMAFRIGYDVPPDWMTDRLCIPIPIGYIIPTFEGNQEAVNGDWIVMGERGEIHLIRHDMFIATYEAVE